MPYIYKITNQINNKIYIGKTIHTPQKRFKEHCKDAFKRKLEKRPLYAAMQKYGIENFFYEALEECSIEELEEKERYWIEYYNSFRNGYNATSGGDGKPYLDYDLIYQTYMKVKDIKKTAQLLNCSEKSVSYVLNIYNISHEERMTNLKVNFSKKVAMIDKNTEEILKVFTGVHDAGKYLGKSHQHIQEVCKGKRKTAYNYKWKYLEN